MIDESFDRRYQAGRADLHEALHTVLRHAGRVIMAAFESLHRIEWSEPWALRGRPKFN